MANQYINPGVVDPTNPEAMQIMQRQKMAEQLMAQGQEPLNGQMVSGHFVAPSWTQQLAKGLNMYMGAKGMKEASDEQKALAEKLSQTKQDWLGQMPKAQTIQTQTEVAGPVQPGMQAPVRIDNVTQKPTTEDYLAWATKGMSIDPATAQMGMQYANLSMNREARDESQKAQRDQSMEALKLRMEDQRISQAERLAAQQEMQRLQLEGRKEMQAAQIAAAAENRKLMAAMKEGKAADKSEQWKYDPGSDTWVQPPNAQYPQGRTTASAGKVGALQNLDYLSKQFLGEEGKANGLINTTTTGGYLGVKGALTSGTQSAKEFDNASEQLSTEMRKIFRIPGEGSLSDKEQAQYGVQLPKRGNNPELNRKIINDLMTRARNSVTPAGFNPLQRGANGSWDAPSNEGPPLGAVRVKK